LSQDEDFQGGEMAKGDYLPEAVREFQKLKALAEKALAQVADADFFAALDQESNSIAVIMKHLAGNMLSRWTDFLNSDGEKPGRNRDSEFVIERGETREWILERWETGWRSVQEALAPLEDEDLRETITIRGEPHTVLQAINRQLSHYACHVGQIVFLAKHFASGKWQSLTIPRGKSEEVNDALRKKWIEGRRTKG